MDEVSKEGRHDSRMKTIYKRGKPSDNPGNSGCWRPASAGGLTVRES